MHASIHPSIYPSIYLAMPCHTIPYITYITLHYIHDITLHYVTLRYITLHYVTLRYITLHYVTLRYITLHYIHTHRYIYIYIYIYQNSVPKSPVVSVPKLRSFLVHGPRWKSLTTICCGRCAARRSADRKTLQFAVGWLVGWLVGWHFNDVDIWLGSYAMLCAIDKVSGKTVDVIGSLRIALTDLFCIRGCGRWGYLSLCGWISLQTALPWPVLPMAIIKLASIGTWRTFISFLNAEFASIWVKVRYGIETSNVM